MNVNPPLVVPLPVGGALLGYTTLQSIYAAAASGHIPVLPAVGRKRCSVARLSELLGCPITAVDIAAAEAAIEPACETNRASTRAARIKRDAKAGA